MLLCKLPALLTLVEILSYLVALEKQPSKSGCIKLLWPVEKLCRCTFMVMITEMFYLPSVMSY